MADLSGATVSEFQPQTAGQVPPAQNEFVASPLNTEPSITQHTPRTYALLSTQQQINDLQAQGKVVTQDDLAAIHKDAFDRAQNFQADIAKTQASKTLELQQRAAAAQRGPQGQPSLLETEEAQRAGTGMQIEQLKEGAAASEQAAQLSQATGKPAYIKALPDDQRQRLEKLENAYQMLNNLQGLHQNMVQQAPGTGGILRNTIGGLFTQPGLTSKYARDFMAYQDETLTPLALGVLGDKAAGATKENIQQQLLGTVPAMNDTIEQAGNKIFMMKDNIMRQLQTMSDLNYGRYSTAEIDRLHTNLSKDFTSNDVQKYNPFTPAQQTPLVQIGTSPQTAATITNAITAGLTNPTAGPNAPAYTIPPGVAQPQVQPTQPQVQPTPQQFYTSGAD